MTKKQIATLVTLIIFLIADVGVSWIYTHSIAGTLIFTQLLQAAAYVVRNSK